MDKTGNIRHRPYLYQPGDTFETRHGTMTIVDRGRMQGKGRIFRKYYVLQCEKGHQYPVYEGYLKAGRLKTCKKCNHPTILEADPAFAAWFVDPNIPRQRPHGCHDKADFYCQRCGKIVRGKNISNVYKRQEVPCPYCTNGVSYPERYLIALLEQMQVPFQHQYTVRFTRNGRSTHYKYDFYDRERGLVIETHGQQHYEPGTFERVGGQALAEIRQTDVEKARYATDILHLNYIELDCRRSDPDWIRREVLKKLTGYPLHTVDWAAVRQQANRSVILQMIDLRKEGYTLEQIGQIVHMVPGTVSWKLKKARMDGLYDGITPQSLRAEENRRLKEEKQERARREKERLEALRALREDRRAEWAERMAAAQKNRAEKLRRLSIELPALTAEARRRTPLTLLCPTCGREFTRSVASMLKDDSCPWCRKLQSLKRRLFLKYGDEYEILNSCFDRRTPLKIRHKACGEVFFRSSSELTKYGCPICGKRQRLEKYRATRLRQGEEKFFALLPEFERRGYPYAGELFRGFSKANAFRCSHCGQIWWTTAYHILSGRDHICVSPCRKKTHQEFVDQVNGLVGEEYTVLGEYQTAFTPVRLRHNRCGFEYFVAPAHFISGGRRCPVCTSIGGARKSAGLQTRADLCEEYLQTKAKTGEGLLCFIWEQKYAQVASFRAQHGHSNVPYGYMALGCDLGGWLGDQRKFYRQGRLSADRIRRLEALGVTWNCKEDYWQRTYEEIRQYLQTFGFPQLNKSSSKEERRCYYWIQDQIKRGRKGRVSPEKTALLRELGIEFEYCSDIRFETMCDKLRRFAEEKGHCIVPLDEGKGEDDPLGLWAQHMRHQLAAGTLPPDRAARLIQLGLPNNNKAAKFQHKLELFTAYHQKHGHLRIPQSYIENGEKLGKWINTLRVNYGKGRLSQEQIAALNAIGMVWNTGRSTTAPPTSQE